MKMSHRGRQGEAELSYRIYENQDRLRILPERTAGTLGMRLQIKFVCGSFNGKQKLANSWFSLYLKQSKYY